MNVLASECDQEVRGSSSDQQEWLEIYMPILVWFVDNDETNSDSWALVEVVVVVQSCK